MSEAEEDDYMSDKFVFEVEEKDIRPGLIHNRSAKRFHEALKQRNRLQEEKKSKKSLIKQLPTEKLKEDLQQPISSSNKGFTLLQKMGFNPGTGLGKSGEGRKDPVPIELKNDRYGLGRKSALEEVAAMKLEFIKAKKKQSDNYEKDYLSRIKEKAAEKTMEIDLMKSQRICFELDTKNGISEPGEPWFWPKKEKKKNCKISEKNRSWEEEGECGENLGQSKPERESEEEEEEEDSEEDEYASHFTTFEKLQVLTLYIRKTYFYCMWCGIHFEDAEDIEKECPGTSRDDH